MKQRPVGAVVCVVQLVAIRLGQRDDAALAGGVDPSGYYVWELAQPRRLSACVEIKGQLGLWKPTQAHSILAALPSE